MRETTIVQLRQPGEFSDRLTEVLREGARRLLGQAVEAEVAAFVSSYSDKETEGGRRRVVRHGYAPARTIQTSNGTGPGSRPAST